MTAGVPNFGNDPDQVQRALGEWAATVRRKAEEGSEVRRQVEAVRVTESSPRGEVTITVDSQGVPTDVKFSSRASGSELSALFMPVLHRAQAKLADRIAEVMPAGQDPATREVVVGEYRQRFPAPPASHPAPGWSAPATTGPPPAAPESERLDPPRPTPPPQGEQQVHGGHDDGDFSDETFLR